MLSRAGRAWRPLPEIVWENAGRGPGDIALVELEERHDRPVTWRELAGRAAYLADILHQLGVRPAETVAVQLPNSADFVVVALASLQIGAVICPIHPKARRNELGGVLSGSEASVLVVRDEFRGRSPADDALAFQAQDSAAYLRHVLVLDRSGLGDGLGDESRGTSKTRVHHVASGTMGSPGNHAALDPDAVAHVQFTSGTTGEPKGVPHRARTLNEAVLSMSGRIGLTAQDCVHIGAPMVHHSGFLYGMWLALVLGAQQVIQPSWAAGQALDALATWRGTFMQGPAAFLSDLVDAVAAGAAGPESLRTFVATGAPVPRGLAERARIALGIRVCVAFGSSETCMVTLTGPDDPEGHSAGTDGRPLEGVRLRVTDGEGRLLGQGREGQLEVASPFAFDGYRKRPDLTAEAFTADRWYRTGDLAVIEPTGYIRITGRIKDVVNRGGEKIPVGAIERLLEESPLFKEVAIVAIPDRRLGERACLFAVPVPGAKPDLRNVCRFLDERHVTTTHWPERLELIEELPRNPAGKILKYLLRDRVEVLEK